MKTRFWTSEKLLSLSALLVSVCTLIVFVYQTNLIQKQQYAAVYPHLAVGNEMSGSLSYRYILHNRGVGPATLTSVRLTTNSGTTYEDFIDYVDAMVDEQDSIWYYHSNIYPGRLIQADEVIPLIQLVDEETLKEYNKPANTYNGAEKLYAILNSDSLSVEITYESIYGESWTITNGAYAPVKN